MSARHIIAFDAGGTAVKAAVYDARGFELAVAMRAMPALHPAPGRLERDPRAMWSAICDIAREVVRTAAIDPASIAVVGVTGYGDGLHLIDGNGEPVRNAILSPDQRAQAIVDRWRAVGREEKTIPLTYQRQWAGKPAPLIAWLEAHEPDALARAAHALMCPDYVRFRLTGVLALEVSGLSSAGLIDQKLRRWTPRVLELFGLGRYAQLFGETMEPLTIAGRVSQGAAAETGLVAGTPVSAGYADGPSMAIGLGATGESLISVISGTWGLNQLASRIPVTDGSISAPILGPRPGEFILIQAAPTSASAFEWFVDSIIGRVDGGRRDREALFDFCNEEVSRTRPEDSPPVFLPYLNGRLNDPKARGAFAGLASWHSLGHIIRAIYEGVAFEHRAHIDHLLRGRAPPVAARFAGGAARSQPWLRIFASAFDAPLELAAANELGALGAAIVAAVGVGLYPDLETAVATMTRVRERVEPDRELAEILSARYKAFKKLRDSI